VGALDPANVGALLVTRWGSSWILLVGAALLLLAALALARTHVRGGWTIALVVPPVLALASAMSGHAAALEESAPVAVALDALHVLAASTWLGGLATLVIVGLRAAVALPAPAGRAAGALVNAFSPVALLSGTLVVLTGSAQAVLQLGSLAELTGSTYGRVLLIKLALVLLALGAGAFNWRRVRPRFEREDATAMLRRSGRVELAVALGILLVTAILVAVPTPR
jgi:copper transport protein